MSYLFIFIMCLGILGSVPNTRELAAVDLSSSYEVLKTENPECIERLIAGGATEADIQAFMEDLEDDVSARGTLTEANFNSMMYASIAEVVTWRAHRNIFRALLESYGEEIDYTLANGELHPELVPIRNAVKDAVLAEPEEDVLVDNGSGSPGGTVTTDTMQEEVNHQISSFSDLSGHWAAADIAEMVSKGFVKGISTTEFAPQRNITRAEFAAILLRALGITEETQLMGSFYDVSADHWYFGTVNTAAKLGLITGYTPTSFGPEDKITREQIAVMLDRALAYKNKTLDLDAETISTKLSTFQDQGLISSWAQESVATAVALEIVKGRTTTQFAPNATATRAEAAVMILRTTQQF